MLSQGLPIRVGKGEDVDIEVGEDGRFPLHELLGEVSCCGGGDPLPGVDTTVYEDRWPATTGGEADNLQLQVFIVVLRSYIRPLLSYLHSLCSQEQAGKIYRGARSEKLIILPVLICFLGDAPICTTSRLSRWYF